MLGIMLRSFGNLPGASDIMSKFFPWSNDLLNVHISFNLTQLHRLRYNFSPELSWHLSDARLNQWLGIVSDIAQGNDKWHLSVYEQTKMIIAVPIKLVVLNQISE